MTPTVGIGIGIAIGYRQSLLSPTGKADRDSDTESDTDVLGCS
jgi:hypothetical protein